MRSPLRWLLLALVGLHVVSAASAALLSDWDRPGFVTGDSLRYHEIATASGVPYRDHDVEYPPLALAAIEVVARPSDAGTAGVLLVLTQLLADLAVVRRARLRLAPRGGDGLARAAAAVLLGRLDLRPARPALCGPGHVGHRHRSPASRRCAAAAALLLGLAVFAKAWPLVALPGLALERRRAALRAAMLVVAIGGLAWVAVGGVDGVRQVVTFRDAKGWQVESTVGSLLLLDLGRPGFSEANALRIGTQAGVGTRCCWPSRSSGASVAAWALAWRAQDASPARRAEAADLATLVAIGLLLVLLTAAVAAVPRVARALRRHPVA